jgi:hypothetical protein
MAKYVRFKWYGNQVLDRTVAKTDRAMEEVGKRWKEETQRQLYPGHGYLTGALHDSIYYEIRRHTKRTYVLVGSPLKYAIWVHEGHHTPSGNWWEGYHYIINAKDIITPEIPAILEAYRL